MDGKAFCRQFFEKGKVFMIKKLAKSIKKFETENPWLTDYSVYMAVKEEENMKPWWQWSDRHAHYHTCIQDIYSYELQNG